MKLKHNSQVVEDIFIGNSEMSALMGSYNWEETPLGRVETWSQSLKTAIRIMLGSRYPMFICWGDSLTCFYNDACISLLKNHPQALGKSASQVWKEIWDNISYQIETVLRENSFSNNQNLSLTVERNGCPEEAYFTFEYSPISGNNDVGGIFCTCVEELYSNSNQTDRTTKVVEIETQISEANLKDALSFIRDGFVILDYNWRFTYLNNPQAEIIGMRREDILGKSFWEVFADFLGSEVEQQLRKVMLERTQTQFEYYYPTWNCWFDIRVYPTLEGIAIITADIDERKRTNSALGETEERFRQMAETIENVFWLFDLQAQQHLYISPAYEKIWGRSCESLYTNFHSWIDTIHPEDRDRIRLASVRCVENKGLSEEYRIIRPDGSIRWVRDRGFVVNDENGQLYRLAGVTEDITEQKQAELTLREQEARLQFMLECSQIGEWDLDLTTEPYTAIRSLKHDQIFGYESLLPEWSYEIFLSHVYPDDREYVDSSFQETLTSYVDWDFECRIIHPDGKIAWIWARGSVYWDKDGDPIRLIGSVTDITQRKKADEKLRESERRLRRLVESNMFGVVLGDSFGGLHYANDYLLNIIGYTSAEIESGEVRWDELTPPEFAALDTKAIEEMLAKGVCTPYEKVYRHRDGRRIPILVGAALLNEPFNQNQEVVAFVLDLTQLKQVTQERDRFFNLSGDMLGIANPEGYFTQVNPAWERILGWTPTEITTKPYIELVHPDDRSETLAEAQKLAQGCSSIGFENRYLSKNGSYRWISWSVASFPEYKIRYSVARDVTEQKQTELALRKSELNFRTLADSMPQIVWTARADGFIDYYNQRWFDYTGMTLEQTLGRGWEPVLHPDDLQMCVDVWSESVSTGNEYNIQYRFRRASDGEYHWFLGRAIPLHDDNGQIVKWFGSSTDIHDLKIAREAAEEANRIKDEFLAVLSHELRTPLNPILGWTTILQKGNLNAQKTEIALKTIERNAKLQTQLIDDLLDISRIIRGKLSLNQTPVNLATVIQGALETVRLAAEAKSITIHTLKASSIGIVNGDEGRLQQVVWNLLSNAVKFTSKGGHIWIELTQIQNHAQIQVKDTGKGIKREFLSYIFDHFRQEDSATTRKFGGLGLGLAIVRQLVELHGGTVKADSGGEGQGSIFTVEIPTTLVIKSTELPQVNQPQSNLSGINILVVDDEADSRELIAFILQQGGATVTTAASASEALEKITKSTPDLLISDIGMPDMDGYELMKIIRASEKSKLIPAIAVTAYAGEANEDQAISVGFQQHISKPIDANAVVNIVIELVRS